jgi:hypothetical protein
LVATLIAYSVCLALMAVLKFHRSWAKSSTGAVLWTASVWTCLIITLLVTFSFAFYIVFGVLIGANVFGYQPYFALKISTVGVMLRHWWLLLAGRKRSSAHPRHSSPLSLASPLQRQSRNVHDHHLWNWCLHSGLWSKLRWT